MKYLVRWISEGALRELHTNNMDAAIEACIALAVAFKNMDIEVWQGAECMGRYRHSGERLHGGRLSA